jgi:hypothetical protein
MRKGLIIRESGSIHPTRSQFLQTRARSNAVLTLLAISTLLLTLLIVNAFLIDDAFPMKTRVPFSTTDGPPRPTAPRRGGLRVRVRSITQNTKPGNVSHLLEAKEFKHDATPPIKDNMWR